jgi:hypothetical protein
MFSKEIIENWFRYHRPTNEQQERYVRIREKAKELAHTIIECTPSCPDQTVALRKLRETVMAANQVIACNEKDADGQGGGYE